jgi:hypothetical protein
VHCASQHTPSAQNPLRHSLGPLHALPADSFATHCPPTHAVVVASWQSESVAQLVWHELPTHLYGAHGTSFVLSPQV